MSTASTRYEAALKVTGRAVFEGEMRPEGLLHAALVETPIACGDVVSLDTTAACTLPGVSAIVSYSDAAMLKPSPTTALIRERSVHFAGQPVALVAAATLSDAQNAARAVRVAAQSRPAVTSMAQSLDTAFVPAMVGRFPAESRRGDAAKALADADLIVRNRYETAVNNHHPMEPHAVVCWLDVLGDARREKDWASGPTGTDASTNVYAGRPSPGDAAGLGARV